MHNVRDERDAYYLIKKKIKRTINTMQIIANFKHLDVVLLFY